MAESIFALGSIWVPKNGGLAVKQALFDALLPNMLSKQPAKKNSGPVTLFAFSN
jgi:hypothetical protein